MAVALEHRSVKSFDDWYLSRAEHPRNGTVEYRGLAPCAGELHYMYQQYKREMDARVHNYARLEQLAANEVISPKPDLPNISSGETAGIVRRTARNLVQHTPNVTIVSKFDDDSTEGVFARYILLSKIIRDGEYSADMQQNLFASTKAALTLGFECVIPVLLQDASGAWYIKYDVIHHRDVFPEPGARDIREATSVFVRRYLTKGEVKALIREQVPGWDIAALRTLLQSDPPPREAQSVSQQDRKRKVIPEGYEIITWYSSGGEHFLTFSESTRLLLRIEKNKHPLKWHPVHFLVLEKDHQQALGNSQVELLLGRQEFQDLMLNGAMKLWYRNINPSIIGYGTINAVPNLGPGQYTSISNPNARLETFEVNTQTLLQFGAISQQNAGAMVSLVGTADQQMATQAGGGMSATPQGVEAQTDLVDITTNNYQKAIESFFSRFCSYALTLYFYELSGAGTTTVTVSADARKELINAGLALDKFNPDGSLEIDFSSLATPYYVRCVPGSLTELEDAKQLRILNELFVPLSQAMPALAATGDQNIISHAAAAMQFIMEKEIELSGSAHSTELRTILREGPQSQQLVQRQESAAALETTISELNEQALRGVEVLAQAQEQMRQQMSLLAENQRLLLEKLGVVNPASGSESGNSPTG